MRYLPHLLERVTHSLQAPPDGPRYFLLDFPGPPRSARPVIINPALRAGGQMKEQVVVQVLEHAIKVVRFAPRRLDSTYLRAVVEEWQRFYTIGQVDEIYASLRRRREGRRARGEHSCDGAAHGCCVLATAAVQHYCSVLRL